MIDIWKFTSFGTQNFATNFLQVKSENDISQIHRWDDFFCFWWWTNILFSKDEYQNTVFLKNSIKWIQDLWDWFFRLWAWENLSQFIKLLYEKYNTNIFNPMFGLPWTVGWAVIWNAGSFGVSIWDYVHSVRYVDSDFNIIDTQNYKASYRDSSLKWKKIILLEVVLKIPLIQKEWISVPDEYLEKRKISQEYQKTCGSYFKNYQIDKRTLTPSQQTTIQKILSLDPVLITSQEQKEILTIPAWWLIDRCWLRGYELDWVRISQKHANFFVNFDNKKASNILKLADLVKQKVYEQFNVLLQEEVIIV